MNTIQSEFGTCHGVAALVWQTVNGSQQLSLFQILFEVKLSSGVRAVLNHTHSSLVLSEIKRACHGCYEAADEFKIFPPDTPRAVHQEDKVSNGTW